MWQIFELTISHFANLLENIFNTSFQTDVFQNIDTLKNFYKVLGFLFVCFYLAQ